MQSGFNELLASLTSNKRPSDEVAERANRPEQSAERNGVPCWYVVLLAVPIADARSEQVPGGEMGPLHRCALRMAKGVRK